MLKDKKTVSFLLSVCLLCSMLMPVYGIDSAGGSGNTDAVVNQDGSTFSVSVPTSLPISVDSSGVVSVATNTNIVNNSYGPVKVSDVSVSSLNGWSIYPFSTDFRTHKVGLKEYGLVLNGDEVSPSGTVSLSEASWGSISGGCSLPIAYAANISVQKSSIVNLEIANVIFTLGWDMLGGSDGSISYVLASDSDFSGEADGSFCYIGTADYVEVPHVIKGVPVTSYVKMFNRSTVAGVKSTNPNVTNMGYMFNNSVATSLDLSSLNTASVTSMSNMFQGSQATSLDLSSFDTSNVTSMGGMFSGSQATSLLARTQTDADKFNTSYNKPAGLIAVVK